MSQLLKLRALFLTVTNAANQATVVPVVAVVPGVAGVLMCCCVLECL